MARCHEAVNIVDKCNKPSSTAQREAMKAERPRSRRLSQHDGHHEAEKLDLQLGRAEIRDHI